MQDTNNVITNIPQKGLVTDLIENLINKEFWSHARNVQMSSHLGQSLFLQNEPSNYECISLPYTPIGFIKLLNNKWVVFTTDNVSSEIGIFDENKCSYNKLINASCLNFKTTNLIQGVSKENFDCTESIYWTDNLNPKRYLNLSKIPYKYTLDDDACLTKIPTNEIDCDELLLEPKISVPIIKPSINFSGNLENGTYQFAIAYANNSTRLTEFYTITKPVRIWTKSNLGQSILLELSNLDRSYEQIEIACIYTSGEATSYHSLGYYNISSNSVLISSIKNSKVKILSLEQLITKRPRYPFASIVGANDQYLLWGNVTTRQEINYQLQAFNIKTKYVVYQVPSDYYSKGGIEVGYERDEVYSFGIQWLYNTGEWSSVINIPGESPKPKYTQLASGPNVYETEVDENNCGKFEKVPNWLVNNTASNPRNVLISKPCNEKIIAEGDMGYHESVEKYPNNPELFGQWSCTPIRHHKFPDNSITHIHSNNGSFINILGVKFENIEHPKLKNGSYDNDIVGYRILRGDRKNNRTIIAKGLVSNVRSYKEKNITVYYPNYPYNDLRPDSFLSSKQTKGVSGSEKDFLALKDYHKDKFNFYGPHTNISNTSLGTEFKIYTEEIADVIGQFQKVYKHPSHKLLTQFDLYFALIIGALDGYYSQKGKKCVTKIKNQSLTLGTGITTTTGLVNPQSIKINDLLQEQACDDALAFTSTIYVDKTQLSAAERVLRTLAKVGVFAYFTMQTAQRVLEIISNFSPWQQYTMQYNSVGNFINSISVNKDSKRRYISNYQYVRDGLNTIKTKKFNNFKRETSVYLELHKSIDEPKTLDNSRRTIKEFGICDNKEQIVNSKASMYYSSIKRKLPNQYGAIDSINYLDTGYIDISLINKSSSDKERIYETDVVFGGDTFINKMSIKRTHHYFNTFLHDVADGYMLDYRYYRNVAYPRYWMDTKKYNLSNFVSLRPSLGRTPANKHNLDCGSDLSSGVTVVSEDRVMYLFNSGILNFFVESDYNLDFRDWKNNQDFYNDSNSDFNELLRSDKLLPESFLYDKTYSKQLDENVLIPQYINTDFSNCKVNLKNRVIYSMPAFKEQKADNWRNYLALNYYDFPLSDFGELTSINSIDNQQFMFLFDKSSPYLSVGRDELQLDGSGKKITLGDGGLFSRDPRPIAYTDLHYGNSQSKNAFLTSQYGIFYPSQRQGRLFNYSGKLEDISLRGNYFWFKNYLPSKLLEQFPEFIHKDNPIEGVSLLSAFDNIKEIYYLTKIDYKLKEQYVKNTIYNSQTNTFLLDNKKISLKDSQFFDNCSWTISYDPKEKFFIGYHDWHPEWTIQSENKFFTVKNNSIWRHNNNYKSFCNFYGKDYPFEIEYVVNNGPNNEILRSIEYILDCGKYLNEGRDFHQVLDFNFDRLVVSNNEQTSGELKLNLQSKKDLTQLFNYPQINTALNYIDILYNKEEQKTRVNMFTDITKDRGEFTNRNYPLWITQSNGYEKYVNQLALNYTKPVQHQKKFRGMWHKILLKRLVSKDIKMIFKIANTKENISLR